MSPVDRQGGEARNQIGAWLQEQAQIVHGPGAEKVAEVHRRFLAEFPIEGGEARKTVWSRRRVREENGLPSPWCFDGLAVGLVGYTVNGKRLYLGRAAFCEWMRRRVDV